MAEQPNYLLGKGEALTSYVEIRKGSGEKRQPYSFDAARDFLAPRVLDASRAMDALPAAACPSDIAVGILTVHPAFMAKSYFPNDLLNAVGLTPVGSRAATITPRAWTKDGPPQPSVAPEIFVCGSRETFRLFAQLLPQLTEDTKGAEQLIEIEDFRLPTAEERIKPLHGTKADPLLEIVLHVIRNTASSRVLREFDDYLKSLKIEYTIGRHIATKGLQFVALQCPRGATADIAKFSFLRACREMPTLRHFRVGDRPPVAPQKQNFVYTLPDKDAVDARVKVAVFDGGIPYIRKLLQWVNPIDVVGIGPPCTESLQHGLAVTSALLFGPLRNGVAGDIPFAKIDHYRVIDVDTAAEPQAELYAVLDRVVSVLKNVKYEFVNLSVGPDTPVEDDDINGWTAAIDECLADGGTLLTTAVGNQGEADSALGFNRIQPPADCVNAISVGACDSPAESWSRAAYSCVGPGRSPGRVKPDLVAFGGSPGDPFFVLADEPVNFAIGRWGTSYAAPTVLRAAVGIRAHFGDVLSPLAIRALLIHRCQDRNHRIEEVGHGRICSDLFELAFCEESSVSTVYQGNLDPKQYLRAPIPFPRQALVGKVKITATICFATDTDPKDTINYTRSGLDISMRPHADRFPAPKKDQFGNVLQQISKHAKTATFFTSNAAQLEGELREDEHKWETVMKVSKGFLGSSLKDPVFDIHYNPRQGGSDSDDPSPIPYALVVTINAPRVPTLYNDVVTRYPGLLVQLKPRIAIPVRI